MQFCIQDPSYDNSMYLHETLLSICKHSLAGAGAYAFATSDGIDILLGDESFKSFMNKGTFYLIVGMDDITNTKALETLKKYKEAYGSKITIKAYVHNSRGSTFHPKYSWFRTKEGGVLVIGSGNLTQNGLRHNREAYGVCVENADNFNVIVETWDKWLEHSKPFLFDIDSNIAIERAKQNMANIQAVYKAKKDAGEKSKSGDISTLTEVYKQQPKDKKQSGIHRTKDATSTNVTTAGSTVEESKGAVYEEVFDYDNSYWLIDETSKVLVAEIPKSGNRWKQANFDKSTFEEYFGATCGENGAYRILLKSIGTDLTLGDTEVRPGVSVASQNYRFELDAASGLAYPTGTDRPIAVFAKVSQRDFLYELLMPSHPAYTDAKALLDKTQKRSQKMRRITFSYEEAKENLPSLALWSRVD